MHPTPRLIPEYHESRALFDLAFATREGHGGRLSAGAFVLLDRCNAIDPYTENPSDQCAAYDRMCEQAARVIAAGC